ncbi:ATP synthase subunit B family protein, partial [Staphylococcus epidermidis]
LSPNPQPHINKHFHHPQQPNINAQKLQQQNTNTLKQTQHQLQKILHHPNIQPPNQHQQIIHQPNQKPNPIIQTPQTQINTQKQRPISHINNQLSQLSLLIPS